MTVSETSLVGRLESGPDASRDYGLHLRKYQALCDEAKETIGRLTRELGRVGSQNYRLIGELADMKSRALTAEAQRDGAYEHAARFCDGWLAEFENAEIQHVSARVYAVDAVKDIATAIRAARLKPDQEEIHRTKPTSTQNTRIRTALEI